MKILWSLIVISRHLNSDLGPLSTQERGSSIKYTYFLICVLVCFLLSCTCKQWVEFLSLVLVMLINEETQRDIIVGGGDGEPGSRLFGIELQYKKK